MLAISFFFNDANWDTYSGRRLAQEMSKSQTSNKLSICRFNFKTVPKNTCHRLSHRGCCLPLFKKSAGLLPITISVHIKIHSIHHYLLGLVGSLKTMVDRVDFDMHRDRYG